MASLSKAFLTGIASSLFFVVLNVAMNIYTKWLYTVGNFALPWTVLAIQQVQSFLVLHPMLAWMRKRGWDRPATQGGRRNSEEDGTKISQAHLIQVVLVTLLFCINVGLNGLSLVHISITLNQTVRAFLPVGVLLLGCCLEARAYPMHAYVTTSTIVMGIAFTCWGSPDFQWLGFSLVFVSTLTAAVGTSLNGRLLNNGPFGKSGPYGVAQLIYVQSIPAMVIFAFIALFMERDQAFDKFSLSADNRWQCLVNLLLVSCSSVVALFSNLGRCFLVAATSPLTETLAGNAKVAALCIIDHELFGTVLHWWSYIGIGLTFSGFSLHLLLQYATKEEDKERANTAETDGGRQGVGEGQQARLRKQVNRPRIISAADTGLAAEHLAVEMGREQLPQFRPLPNGGGSVTLNTIPELPRPRSVTWPLQPTAQEKGGMWSSVDFSLVLELPPWLSGFGQPGGPEEYSPLGAGLSPMARRSMVHNSLQTSSSMSPTSKSRSRFYSDPTDSNNNRSRLIEDVRLGNKLHAVEEEVEMDQSVPGEPPNLDWL